METESHLKIQPSRKWVLPPRPKPGRKPSRSPSSPNAIPTPTPTPNSHTPSSSPHSSSSPPPMTSTTSISSASAAKPIMVEIDSDLISNPIKQEILKINEENYYLKLEVIRIVSNLKEKKFLDNSISLNTNERKINSISNDSEDGNAITTTTSTSTSTNTSTTNSKILSRKRPLQEENEEDVQLDEFLNLDSNDITNFDDELLSSVSTTPSTLFSLGTNESLDSSISNFQKDPFQLLDFDALTTEDTNANINVNLDIDTNYNLENLLKTNEIFPLENSKLAWGSNNSLLNDTIEDDFIFNSDNDVDLAFEKFVSGAL